ncbi:ATP dependent DNA ligase domain-containing protein [Micromonospora inositola]|uniref:ATP dependent DNA ligase domain-containing protein n=2 Tax=Micromonospora inositola TaxID=47865 RepID=A0A1C5K573_9ACTN|nr:ATP dependent DNA ligase domain-containing protein [Micromonospora inositola]
MVRPPVEPMLAKSVDTVPRGRGLAYEPKWDGWRAIAFRHHEGVCLQSRAGRDLGAYFPDVIDAVTAAVAPGAVLDGELVVWEADRTDFSLLQRRVTAGAQRATLARRHPAHYVVFDLLSAPPGLPLLDKPLAERRALLTSLLADAPAQLTLSPQSTDVGHATEWLHTWTAAGIEGVMIKRLDGRYEPGRRAWQKYRAYHTTEAIIGGVNPHLTNPEILLLGRLDEGGRLRYTGRTHALRPDQRAELATLLTPHPSPDRTRQARPPVAAAAARLLDGAARPAATPPLHPGRAGHRRGDRGRHRLRAPPRPLPTPTPRPRHRRRPPTRRPTLTPTGTAIQPRRPVRDSQNASRRPLAHPEHDQGVIHSPRRRPQLAASPWRGSGLDDETELVGEAAARLLATATCRWSSPSRRPPTSRSPRRSDGTGTGLRP